MLEQLELRAVDVVAVVREGEGTQGFPHVDGPPQVVLVDRGARGEEPQLDEQTMQPGGLAQHLAAVLVVDRVDEALHDLQPAGRRLALAHVQDLVDRLHDRPTLATAV